MENNFSAKEMGLPLCEIFVTDLVNGRCINFIDIKNLKFKTLKVDIIRYLDGDELIINNNASIFGTCFAKIWLHVLQKHF